MRFYLCLLAGLMVFGACSGRLKVEPGRGTKDDCGCLAKGEIDAVRTRPESVLWISIAETAAYVDIPGEMWHGKTDLGKLLKRSKTPVEEYSNFHWIEADDPFFRYDIPIGEPFTAVTARGTVMFLLIGAQIGDGPSDIHLKLVFKVNSKFAGLSGPAFRGRLSAEDQRFNPLGKGGRPGNELEEKVVSSFKSVFEEHGRNMMSDKDRDRFGPNLSTRLKRVQVGRESMSWLMGSFPKQQHALVRFDNRHEQKGGVDSNSAIILTALFFVSPNGKISHFISEPAFGTSDEVDTPTIHGTWDMDGDGVDEVFYLDWHFEEGFETMLKWNGKKWKKHKITGGGA
jgi:hypothetical protein